MRARWNAQRMCVCVFWYLLRFGDVDVGDGDGDYVIVECSNGENRFVANRADFEVWKH